MQRNEKFENFIEEGRHLEAKGELIGALIRYTLALQLNSHSFEALSKRGSVLFSLEKYQIAVKDFNAALAIAESVLEKEAAACRIASAYFKLCDYELALTYINKAIAFNPSRAAHYNRRAYFYFEMGDFIMAAKNCGYCLSILPDHANVYVNITVIKNSIKHAYQAILNVCANLGLATFFLPDASIISNFDLGTAIKERVADRLKETYGVDQLGIGFLSELKVDIGPGLYKQVTIQQVVDAYIDTVTDPHLQEFDESFKASLQKMTGLVFSVAEIDAFSNQKQNRITIPGSLFSTPPSSTSKKRTSTTMVENLEDYEPVAAKKACFKPS